MYAQFSSAGFWIHVRSSEVVGRPLAALLANDGARVFSVDIDSVQEYTKRPQTESTQARKYHPHHVMHPCSKTLQECLAISDVVITAVPSASYKVKTDWLKDGCVCVNVSSEKNFEKDVREKVCVLSIVCQGRRVSSNILLQASIYIPAVGKVTILMLLRNLYVLCDHFHGVSPLLTLFLLRSLRLRQYQDVLRQDSEQR